MSLLIEPTMPTAKPALSSTAVAVASSSPMRLGTVRLLVAAGARIVASVNWRRSMFSSVSVPSATGTAAAIAGICETISRFRPPPSGIAVMS